MTDDRYHEATWRLFRRELRQAEKANRRHPLVRSWSSPETAMEWMRKYVPYKFDPDVPVADLGTVLERGFASCGEAAAAISALARNQRESQVRWCLELRNDLPRYAHVVTVVRSTPYDVYSEAARVVSGCTFSWVAGR